MREFQPVSSTPHFVIPAKAGIQLLPVKFPTGRLRKPKVQVMDPRLRGGDEATDKRVSCFADD